MGINLPKEFEENIKKLLGEEYKEFKKSFDKERFYGLRVNRLKSQVDEFLKLTKLELNKIPWSKDGFYYSEGNSPGKHPHYYAGLYYIQEPSAMFPVEVLGCKPGDRVLDLCAAPGGKSVQIAADLNGEGLLVSNDINNDRVKALVKNLELCGVKNAIVTCETPNNLAKKFTAFFDKILVDAPCSGEGMFRKDPDAVRSWGKYKNEVCSKMQTEILAEAEKMLKVGGELVYSTCTFHPDENERKIEWFLDNYHNFELVEIVASNGIVNGRSDWTFNGSNMDYTKRLWPHNLDGEGHFVAKLRKLDGSNSSDIRLVENFANEKEIYKYREFEDEMINNRIGERILRIGNNIYWIPDGYVNLDGLKVAKFGWYLGEVTEKYFIPSHAMVMALKSRDVNKKIEFSSDDINIIKYLKGETLLLDGENGYHAITVDGFTVGWGKRQNEIVKNLYPKGWRKIY